MSTEPHGHHGLTEAELMGALTALVQSADKDTHISPALGLGTSANTVVRRALGMDHSPTSQKRAAYILQRLREFGYIERTSSYRVRILPRTYASLDKQALGLSDYEEFTRMLNLADSQREQARREADEYRAENEMLWEIIHRNNITVTPADIARAQFRSTARSIRRHNDSTA